MTRRRALNIGLAVSLVVAFVSWLIRPNPALAMMIVMVGGLSSQSRPQTFRGNRDAVISTLIVCLVFWALNWGLHRLFPTPTD